MTICPNCGHQNIAGVDVCDECETSLSYMSHPRGRNSLEQSILKDPVKIIEPRPPFLVPAGMHVAEVLRRMVQWNVGCAMVVDDRQELIGVFTERDAVRRLGPEIESLADRPVREFMTVNPATIEEDDRLAQALHKMDLGEYRHLPVLRRGRVVGLLSARDILRYLADRLQLEEAR